jgi:hypothetical protein
MRRNGCSAAGFQKDHAGIRLLLARTSAGEAVALALGEAVALALDASSGLGCIPVTIRVLLALLQACEVLCCK